MSWAKCHAGTAWTVIEWINWASQLLAWQNVQSRRGVLRCCTKQLSNVQQVCRCTSGWLGDANVHSVTAGVMSRNTEQLLAVTGVVKVFIFLSFVHHEQRE